MIRPWLLASVALMIGAASVRAEPVAGSSSAEGPDTCEYWSPIHVTRPGQRKLHLAEFKRGYYFRGRNAVKGRTVPGWFIAQSTMLAAFFVDPYLRLGFTVPAGDTIDFVPDGEQTSIKVTMGWADLDARAIQGYRSITCPSGEPGARPISPPLSVSREPEKPLSDLADKYNKGVTSEPAKPKAAEAPKSLKKSMGEAAVELSPIRKNTPPDTPPTESMAEAMRRAVAPDAAKPAPRKAHAVCDAGTLQPLEALDEGALANLQLVGLRNQRTEVGGSDYLNVSGDLIPLDYAFDVTDSVGKLTTYEPVSNVTGAVKGSDLTWVSLPGQPRPVANPKAPRPAPVTLKMIVIGGAPEVVYSGFDRVSAELRKISRGPAPVEIAWYTIENSGATRLVAQYNSFEDLIKAASERVGDGRPAALTQGQIETLLDGIERLLTSQTTPIDKVYWLKGAYSLPSSFPARFERLLNAVSESKAVVRAPNGNVGKWLGVITARMPGFSIAYLKEPVYSMQIGDVIEEIDSKTESRRFIDDPNMVAVRLRASAAMRLAAQPAPAPSSDTPSLTGRLVHSAKDLFDQRGYLLAPDAANTLHAGLRAVQQLWTATEGAASVKESALKETAGRLKKSAPSLNDVLQDLPGGVSLKLPRGLPDWIRKPLKDLNATESLAAYSFVSRYAAGVEKLVQSNAKLAEAGTEQSCALTFVTEESLGFPKL